jgi:hypothetical protein
MPLNLLILPNVRPPPNVPARGPEVALSPAGRATDFLAGTREAAGHVPGFTPS